MKTLVKTSRSSGKNKNNNNNMKKRVIRDLESLCFGVEYPGIPNFNGKQTD